MSDDVSCEILVSHGCFVLCQMMMLIVKSRCRMEVLSFVIWCFGL